MGRWRPEAVPVPSAALERRWFVIDVAAAVLLFGVSASILLRIDILGGGVRPPNAAAYLLVAIYTAPVIARRRFPVAAVVVSLAAGVATASGFVVSTDVT